MKHHITIQSKKTAYDSLLFCESASVHVSLYLCVEANKHALDEQKMECIFNICNLSGSHCTEIRQEFTLNLVFL